MDLRNPPITLTLDSAEWALVLAALDNLTPLLPPGTNRYRIEAINRNMTTQVHDGIHALVQELTGETFGR